MVRKRKKKQNSKLQFCGCKHFVDKRGELTRVVEADKKGKSRSNKYSLQKKLCRSASLNAKHVEP